MPVTWQFQGSILVVATIGEYSTSELEGAVLEASKDPNFLPGTPILFDGRKSEAKLSREDIERRMHWILSLPKQGFARRAAIMVGSEPHRFGFARMLQMRLEFQSFKLEIFIDEGEAVRWLGHP